MRRFLILMLFALTFLPVIALADVKEEWVATYEGANIYGGQLALDSSGNIYTHGGGTTIKYDINGNELWVRAHANTPYDSDMVVDPSGNVYVAGTDYTFTEDFFIVKYDTNGNTLWERKYDAGFADRAVAIEVDSSGNVYITGSSEYYPNTMPSSVRFATVKYDKDGNQLWVAKSRFSWAWDAPNNIATDANGNVYVTGKTYLIAPWIGGSGVDYLTIKYDSNGNQLWAKTYDGGGTAWGNRSDAPRAIALDNAGNVYVTGESHYGSNNGFDYATVKYDTNGNELWTKRYNASYGDIPFYIALDSSGNAYVTGISNSGTATIKYDTNGNELWIKNIPESYGAGGLALDLSGNVYICTRYPYFYTTKYDADGNEVWATGRTNGTYGERATSIAVDSKDNVYVAGVGVNELVPIEKLITVKYSQTDKIPPVITIASPTAGDYAITDSVLIDFIATDEGSGINTVSASIDGRSVQSGETLKLYELGAGSHTLTIDASDIEGNTSTASVTINVTVTAASLTDLIWLFYDMGLIENKGIATSLVAQLENGAIVAFINHLDAQSGKLIDSDAAAILKSAATAL